MSNQKKEQQESKRKTLKTILGGTGAVAGASALPDKWSKPIMSSVILPVHAQGTPAFICDDYSIRVDYAGREITVDIVGPVNGEATVELIINYDDESGEAQTLDNTYELTSLIQEGVSIEVPTESGSQTESADASEVSSVESVVANFDACEIYWD